MNLTLIEINDLALRWQSEDLVHETPAWALIDEPLALGQEALQQARLQPRKINNQFWQQLSTDAMPGATQDIRHHADLAFRQLCDIHQQAQSEAYVFCMPAHYERPQLSLLLGLAEAASMTVKALVDPGVLLTRLADTAAPLALYLDCSLHGVSLTAVSNLSQVSREKALLVHPKGVLSVVDRLANQAAKKLIQSQRFDPLHHAATEQQLFSQLFGSLNDHSCLGSKPIQLQYDAIAYDLALSDNEQRAATIDVLPDIVRHIQSETTSTAELMISHRAAMLPGLLDAVSLIPSIKVTTLASETLFKAFDAAGDILASRQDNNQLIYQMPSPASQSLQNSDAHDDHYRITHILYRGVATAVEAYRTDPSAQLTLEQDANGHWNLVPGSTPVALNQKTLSQRQSLSIGDRVTFGDRSFEFIQVR